MATINDDFTFNLVHGKVAAYFDRALTPNFTNVAYVISDAELAAGASLDTKTDSIRDADTWAAVKTIQGQVTTLGEKTLSGITVTVDDSTNQVRIDCDDWQYANATAGSKTGAIVMCAKPTGSPTDAQIVPLLAFKYEETTTGSTLNILVPTGGFWSAADV